MRKFLIAFLLLNAVVAYGQTFCAKSRTLVETINREHLIQQNIDDVFSERVFDAFLATLDPDMIYFNGKDSVWFTQYRQSIDDAILSDNCSFLTKMTTFYSQQLNAFLNFADSALKQSPGYNSVQSVPGFIAKEKKFATNTRSLKQRQLNTLRFHILNRAWTIAHAKGEVLSEKNFVSIEKEARAKILARTHRTIERMLKSPEGFDTYVSILLMKAICLSYDPHTEFFTSAEMKGFESAITRSGLSFGVEFGQGQTGNTEVQRLAPGGPAWKSDLVRKGDALISLQTDSDVLDAADYELEEINEILGDISATKLTLVLRSPDGKTKSVLLKKDKIENAENLISSFVLEGKSKIGYIQLPGFYTNENFETGKGCAGDVAKEIIKLKKEGIQALILDLRFNGGGSVQEALELGGIFIDVGAFAVMEDNKGDLITLKDFNKGSVYTGPLLVMINAFSASASELVAAGLQDYHRAIIMGCGSYGKATGQIVVPLNPAARENSDFVKITQDRIYRVTGKSLQLDGVVPDIEVPEITAAFGLKEQKLRFPVQPKTISKKVYYTPAPPVEFAVLKAGSEKRVSNSAYFKSIEGFGHYFKGAVPLDLKGFIQFMSQLEERSKTLAEDQSAEGKFKVYPSGLNATLFTVDSYHKEISENSLKEINASHYVREACFILDDYLSIKP